jgi:hypothetical protein
MVKLALRPMLDEHQDTLAGRGLVVEKPLSLWPGLRLLPQIDLRLHECADNRRMGGK